VIGPLEEPTVKYRDVSHLGSPEARLAQREKAVAKFARYILKYKAHRGKINQAVTEVV
jgi:hypothetical protein